MRCARDSLGGIELEIAVHDGLLWYEIALPRIAETSVPFCLPRNEENRVGVGFEITAPALSAMMRRGATGPKGGRGGRPGGDMPGRGRMPGGPPGGGLGGPRPDGAGEGSEAPGAVLVWTQVSLAPSPLVAGSVAHGCDPARRGPHGHSSTVPGCGGETPPPAP